MPWHPPGSRFTRLSAWLPLGCLALDPSALDSNRLAAFGAVRLDMGLALFFIVAELCAWFGASMEAALEHYSRSSVLEQASARGIEDTTRARLEHTIWHEITARFVRFLGNALLVLGVGYVALRDHLGAGGTAQALSVGAIVGALAVTFLVTFVINDVVVRALARRDPDNLLLRGLPTLAAITTVTTPIRAPLIWLIQTVFRVRLHEDPTTAREEVRESVEEGEREGTFSQEEAEMIGSIIDLKAERVADVLTPRAELVMLQEDTSFPDALVVINAQGFSRIPVYRRDKDDVVGVLYAHDMLRHWTASEAENLPSVRALMREPFFVPESKALPDLLREMRVGKVHMAIVLDEFNGTLGLATIEDILEQIVGEIDDEYDEESNSPATTRSLANGHFHVEGRTPIEDVNRELQIELPIEDDCETVGGLVFHHLGKVPEAGDRIEINHVALTVLEADERTVKRLEVELPKSKR